MKNPKESDHNLGGLDANAKVTSPRRRQAFLVFVMIVIGALIVGGSYWLWTESRDNSSSGSGLTKEQIETIAAEQDTAGKNYESQKLSVETVSKINALVAKAKYDEAQVLVEKSLDKKGLTSTDKEQLYGSLYVICTNNKDVNCLDEVIKYMESRENEERDVWLYVTSARIAKESGDLGKAKTYYSKALVIVDEKGGKAYLDENFNKDVELGIEYQELTDGAN